MIRRYLIAPVLTVILFVSAMLASPAAIAQDVQSDPSYMWRSDPVSKVLAGKPFAERVLHRVPGSLHDATPAAPEALEAQARGVALFGPGTPIFIDDTFMCTVAVAGYDSAGRKIAITAGHCGDEGQQISSADAREIGSAGRIVAVNREVDYAVIELGQNAEVTRSYNGVTINHLGASPQNLGQVVCKSGFASAYTCGITWLDNGVTNLNQVCAMQGDSGAPLFTGDSLVGMINGGIINLPCNSPLQGPIFSPTASGRANVIFGAMDNSAAPGAGFRLP